MRVPRVSVITRVDCSYNNCGALVQNPDTFKAETKILYCSGLSPRPGAKRRGQKILKIKNDRTTILDIC